LRDNLRQLHFFGLFRGEIPNVEVAGNGYVSRARCVQNALFSLSKFFSEIIPETMTGFEQFYRISI